MDKILHTTNEMAQDDREFEVAMQIRPAIERIESARVGQGSVWRQMTQGIN